MELKINTTILNNGSYDEEIILTESDIKSAALAKYFGQYAMTEGNEYKAQINEVKFEDY